MDLRIEDRVTADRDLVRKGVALRIADLVIGVPVNVAPRIEDRVIVDRDLAPKGADRVARGLVQVGIVRCRRDRARCCLRSCRTNCG